MKTLSIFALFILTFGTVSFAEISEDVFAIDKAEVEERFSSLSEVEQIVENEKLDLQELQVAHAGLFSDPTFRLSKNFSIMGALATMDDPPLGIPSFLWGMCLGLPGLAVVYFVTEDTDETKKALWGCLVSTAVVAVFYVILIIAGASFWFIY